MKVIFEDEKLQKQYEEMKKNLIKKYGAGCSAVFFSPALITNLEDNSQQIEIIAMFEKNGIEENYESIEDGNSSVGYLSSFEEEQVIPDEYSEVIHLER